ncbi:hypothetical protein Esti_004984 [Eimeria stiedai]
MCDGADLHTQSGTPRECERLECSGARLHRHLGCRSLWSHGDSSGAFERCASPRYCGVTDVDRYLSPRRAERGSDSEAPSSIIARTPGPWEASCGVRAPAPALGFTASGRPRGFRPFAAGHREPVCSSLLEHQLPFILNWLLAPSSCPGSDVYPGLDNIAALGSVLPLMS